MLAVYGLVLALGAGVAWYEWTKAEAYEQGENAALAKARERANERLRNQAGINASLAEDLAANREASIEAVGTARQEGRNEIIQLQSRIAEMEAARPEEERTCPAQCPSSCFRLSS